MMARAEMRAPRGLFLNHHQASQGREIGANRVVGDASLVAGGVFRDGREGRLGRDVAGQALQDGHDTLGVAANAVHGPDVRAADLVEVISDGACRTGWRQMANTWPAAHRQLIDQMSSRTSLAACRRAVSVLPQAFGPSITTAPWIASCALNSASTMRGRYSTRCTGSIVAEARMGIHNEFRWEFVRPVAGMS